MVVFGMHVPDPFYYWSLLCLDIIVSEGDSLSLLTLFVAVPNDPSSGIMMHEGLDLLVVHGILSFFCMLGCFSPSGAIEALVIILEWGHVPFIG